MSKFDMSGITDSIRKEFKDKPKMARLVGVGSNLSELTDKDYLTMPEWWAKGTGVPGLPFGRLVMIAGDSDTGKTSAAIQAMRAAQTQGVGVIYVETESKTTKRDLTNWGVDANQIILVQSAIAEEAFELLFSAWDKFTEKYPNDKLLVVFDSIGNVVSQRDASIDITEQDSKPGGRGKVNRLALNKMISKQHDRSAAILVINYCYENIGSHGRTNAGGKAINFFSSLTFQTTRKSWIESVVKGVKKRVGAEVVWKLYKNHLNKEFANNKEFTLRITKDGVQFVE